MHAVILHAQLQSPAREDSVVATLHAVLAEARGFDGCVGVETLVDGDDPTKVVFITRWESTEANDAYLAWRRGNGARGAEKFGALLAGAPSLARLRPAPEL